MPKVSIFDIEENLPSHFTLAKRVSVIDFLKAGGALNRDALQKFIDQHCVQEGQPLVIRQWDMLKEWDEELFNVDHLQQVYPSEPIELYNMKTNNTHRRHTIADFIKGLDPKHEKKLMPVKSRYKKDAKSIRQQDMEVPVSSQQELRKDSMSMDDEPLVPEHPQRKSEKSKKLSTKNIYYAKDLTCPTEYKEKINHLLPDFLLPLGPNDLFSNMPEHLRAENLMCYVGSDKTGTALHRDICGTMGHNLMSYGEEGAYAEWYFIENHHREALLKTFHARKNDKWRDEGLAEREHMENQKSSFVESDRLWVGACPLKKTGFITKLVLQRPGDLVIIPSMCYHQVRNVKTSVKIAWNRATAHTLQLALTTQLPIYQSLVRPEVYRCKAMVYHTLQKNWDRLHKLTNRSTRNNAAGKLLEDCRILMGLLGKDVIYPETIESIPQEGVIDDNIMIDHHEHLYTTICDFCRADIFNRHFRCVSCDNYDLCMTCYSQGRGCEHLDQLAMHQSTETIASYQKFFLRFLEVANLYLIMAGIDPIENTIAEHNDNYSLATVCRRIEMYRKTTKILSNYLLCGHCDSVFTLSELYSKYGLDPYAIFSRKRCAKLSEDENSNIVFTCVECSSGCDSCFALPVITKEISEKVYYSSPRHDTRNWGGPADIGVYKTSHWPNRHSELTNREDMDVQWTQDDALGCIQSAIIAYIDPAILKQSLTKKESSRKLAEAIMSASKQWSETAIQLLNSGMEVRPSEKLYIDELKDLGVSENITVQKPVCHLYIGRKRPLEEEKDQDAKRQVKKLIL